MIPDPNQAPQGAYTQGNAPNAIPVAQEAPKKVPNVPQPGQPVKKQNPYKEYIVWGVVGVFALILLIIVVVVVTRGDDNGGLDPVFLDNVDDEVRTNNDDHVGVVFAVPPPAEERQAFISAALKWSDVLRPTAAFSPQVFFPGGTRFCEDGEGFFFDVAEGFSTDHLIIFALVGPIDGPGNTLAFAGPCNLLPGNRAFPHFPTIGQMVFDTDDNAELIREGTFETVILHEMGHVLGIGTLWSFASQANGINNNDFEDEEDRLLQNPVIDLIGGIVNGFNRPSFIGAEAVSRFNQAGGQGDSVPVEDGIFDGNFGDPSQNFNNLNGQGSVDGHWNLEDFTIIRDNGIVRPPTLEASEVMVFSLLSFSESFPLSAVTIGSLQDLGYVVDFTQADPFTFSSASVAKQVSSDKKLPVGKVLMNDMRTFIPVDE